MSPVEMQKRERQQDWNLRGLANSATRLFRTYKNRKGPQLAVEKLRECEAVYDATRENVERLKKN